MVDPERLSPGYKGEPFDIGAFLGRNGKDKRWPAISACAKALKKDLGFKKVGAIGFCYGGWAVLQLGRKSDTLVDCVSTGHPAMFDNSLGIDWDYQYFAGLKHGFCTRGDQNDEVARKGLERAKNAAVAWFYRYLH